jgi:surface carbohydrate biosynthesis protein
MSVDVIYFVESVPKELDVACIVSQLAKARHGLNVEIASYKAHAPEWLLRTEPKLIVIPTCYAAEAWGLRKHVGRWPNAPFLNLTWEELFCKANLQWKKPSDDFARLHVAHHVWGNFYRDFLMSHGVPREHIIVNGNPGYRLYAPPYCGRFSSREELAESHQLDPAKRWVLFPENYGWAFYSEENMAARARGGMGEAIPAMLRKFCRDSLRTVLEWCSELSRAADIEVIIRPRPTTRLSHFREVSEELLGRPLEGVRLIKEGSVNSWILGSDIVVSSFSTTLIEAAIAGKPAYMVEPVPLPDPLWSVWYEHAESVTTREQFLGACRNPTPASENLLRRWALNNLLATGDPIDNLVECIAGICTGKRKVPSPPPQQVVVQRKQRGLVGAFLRDSWHDLQEAVPWKQPAGDRDTKVFGRRDVSRRMQVWQRLLNEAASESPACTSH